jgi:hypothetical protein
MLSVGVIAVAGVLGARAPQNSRESVKADILRVHESERSAHLRGDADALAAGVAPQLLSVRDGRVVHETRASVRRHFVEYFSKAKHKVWEDVEPPAIGVSADGKMAWAVYRVHSQYMETKPDGSTATAEFTAAWTSTYEQIGGKWLMTTVTSTFQPAAETKSR